MNGTPIRVPVLVAGGGPGGLATAIELRRLGIDAELVDAGDAPRRRANVIGLDDDGVRSLHRLDPAASIADDTGDLGQGGATVELDDLVAALRRVAVDEGVVERTGTSIERIVRSDASGVVTELRGPDGRLHRAESDWLVMATGGADVPGLARPLRSTEPDAAVAERYLAAHSTTSRGAAIEYAQDGAFALSGPRHGTSMFHPLVPGNPPGDVHAAADELARSFGVDPASVARADVFEVRQRAASRAAEGRVLLVGDSVATKLPTTVSGVSLALADGIRAADVIGHAAHGADSSALVEAYELATRLTHAARLR